MDLPAHLIIHNLAGIVSSISTIGLAFFTFLNAPKKTANVAMALAFLSTGVFIISHVIGVNMSDPYVSRFVFMFNLSIIAIGAFNVHAILALTGQDRIHRRTVILIYSVAAFLVIFFVINPDLFLLPSVQKMYFPNYYSAGILNIIRVIFLYGVCVPYIIYLLKAAENRAESIIEKRQFRYMMYSMVGGYLLGFVPNFLVYNIPIDPAIGMIFMIVAALPFVLGAVKYGLFNVKVIAEQAFWYSIAVAIVGGLIALFNNASDMLIKLFPNFPLWTFSLTSAILVVSVSVFVWYRMRQDDVMKYEFIATVSHKFRTPLTHIKWAIENIENGSDVDDMKTQLSYIRQANNKLVELTGLLANVSNAEKNSVAYKIEKNSLTQTVKECLIQIDNQIKAKNIHLETNVEDNIYAKFDPGRISFVIQTFAENAINYTPENGTIKISLTREAGSVVFSVKDSGIGIEREELSLLFSKFYRGHQARLTDTEGMGIGLYMSKAIIRYHDGYIWAQSEGRDRGSTFSFSLAEIT